MLEIISVKLSCNYFLSPENIAIIFCLQKIFSVSLVSKSGDYVDHSGLWCDTSSKWVCLYPMLHCGRGCHISTLILVPINFWQISGLFKKLTKLEHFKENVWNFTEKISQLQNINLWNFLEVLWWFWVSNWIIFGPFGSEMTCLGRSVTYQCFRAQFAPLN